MSGEFPVSLKVEQIDDYRWRLLENFPYHSELLGRWFTVPKGFVTDFASVPRVPVAYWLTGGIAHISAVVHDYLYSTHLTTRSEADQVFLEAAAASNIPAWRRNLMYWGIRAGGWQRWNKPSEPENVRLLVTPIREGEAIRAASVRPAPPDPDKP